MSIADLNSRQASIAMTLLEAYQPLSAQELGKLTGISPRMIHYNLPLVARWFQQNGGRLVSKPGIGVSVQVDPEARSALRAQLREEKTQIVLTSAERLDLLQFELLCSTRYRTRKELARILPVSEATLSRDLKLVAARLHETGLTLVRRPRLGVKVKGREGVVRGSLVALLFGLGLEASLLNLCLWGPRLPSLYSSSHLPLQSHVLARVLGWELASAWRFVNMLQGELHAAYSENALLNLALYWAAMVLRLDSDLPSGLSDEAMQSFKKLPVYPAVVQVAKQFTHETGLRLSEIELARLSIRLYTTDQDLTAAGMPAGGPSVKVAAESHALAAEFIVAVGNLIGYKPLRDDIVSSFAEHLERGRMRLQYGLKNHNPLADQIQAFFPDLWKATAQAAEQLIPDFPKDNPPDEIANLTLYMTLIFGLSELEPTPLKPRVVVTCPKGGVAVWMLVSRLKKELPEIEVVDVVPVRMLGKFDPADIDAVICTIPIELPRIPVITVSPILQDEDVKRLRQKLNLNSGSRPIPSNI